MERKQMEAVWRGMEFCREAGPVELGPEDLSLINRYALEKLSAEEVYVRSMYVASNQIVESDWRAFTPQALQQIERMIPGESVMKGHSRSDLPVARFFKAAVVQREDPESAVDGEKPNQGVVRLSGETSLQLELGPTQWVRAWFYWLRGSSDGEDLKKKIDAGIYREASISWIPALERCSICGKDAWDWENCNHFPGRLYGGQRCIYVTERISEVLEGSLVFKGADKGTGFDRSVKSKEPRMPANGREEVVEQLEGQLARMRLGESIRRLRR